MLCKKLKPQKRNCVTHMFGKRFSQKERGVSADAWIKITFLGSLCRSPCGAEGSPHGLSQGLVPTVAGFKTVLLVVTEGLPFNCFMSKHVDYRGHS